GRRGYNQSRIIAEAVAREWELPCRGLLRKTRGNCRQAGLDMEQRKENVKNVYACTLENVPETVYVADDICTTGSTLHACKTALEQAGVKKVLFITLAHVPHYKK
ncbi:MAG: phosphoribosyltransferase family protein, partial [Clostridia bacterium]